MQRYKHLGALVHHTGGSQVEINQRAATAHQALNQHKKVIYQNRQIPLGKRAELFSMLVLSKLLYGADSWVATNSKTERKFHTTVINLYKRLAGVQRDDHCSDTEVLVMVGLPSPEEHLRRARLRYIVTLVHTELPDIWALLAHDIFWRGMLEEDMLWMWKQLKGASELKDPRQHYEQWLAIIEHSPGFWKRLVKRACHHSVLQRQREHQVCDLHHRVLGRLRPLIHTQDPDADDEDLPQ